MWWMAVAGAAINQISHAVGTFEQQNEISRQQNQARKAYEAEKDFKEAAFQLQRGQAIDEAAFQQNRLREALGVDIQNYNLGLANQALAVQDARISLADSAGTARAQQGMSGVRGSDTLQRRLDYAERTFSQQLALQQQNNSAALQGLTRQYSNQFEDIGRELDSWNPGGYRYHAKDLEAAYAQQMHELQMNEYNQAYADAAWNVGDFLLAGLQGAGQGMSFGNTVQGWMDQKQASQPAARQAPDRYTLYGPNRFGYGY